MDSKRRVRFIILDLCHPMSSDTVKTVIDSLKNALVLSLTLSLNEVQFGIFVLKSDFKLIHSRNELLQNYDTFFRALQDLLKIAKENTKVTVQKYKELTSQSLSMIFHECLPKPGSPDSSKQLQEIPIQIAIITKKTASVLVEILTDVLNKLERPNSKGAVKKFKIVQILDENEEICKTQQKNDLFECITCLNQPHHLTCFFKDWLLNQEEYLEILINEHLNLSLKCDVDNCLVKPTLPFFEEKVHSNAFNRIPSPDSLKPKNLEIIGKIPSSRFCPNLMFGVPRRITATLNNTLTWGEFQTNRHLFKGFCLELKNTGQGIITRSRIKTEGPEIFVFQFITSDGDMLLMNDVAPEELYIPKSVRSLKAENIDENVADLVKICLENIKLLDEYNPRDFESGIYEYLMNYLIQPSKNKIPSKRFNSTWGKKFLFKPDKNNKNDTLSTDKENRHLMKKPKLNPDTVATETENLHPALLPQDTVHKYRKMNSNVFKLLELSRDFSKDLEQWN